MRNGVTQRKPTRRNMRKQAVPRGIGTLTTGSNLQFGFPDRVVSKLRYVDTFPIASTAGSIAKQLFYVNSVFDPDASGIGHQPLYRDTFAAVYDQYAVISADIEITFVAYSGTIPLLVGVVLDDDGTTSTTANTLMEQSHGQSALMPWSSGSPSTHKFKVHWDCKKILQIDPFSSETYKTAVGSNPTEVSSLLCWMNPADGSSSLTTYLHVCIEQTVLWTELTTPVQS
jgi:hypothetical protein